MKAVVQDRYGPPEAVLARREIEPPTPGRGEVLVRVRASSVHPDVWHAVTGRPWALRLMGAGVRRPKDRVPGNDLAGTVEAVGPEVASFRPGDAVFGVTSTVMQWRNGGAWAELAVAPQDGLAAKPDNVSFEAAASVPASGWIALLNLRDGELIPEGGNVLINGAAGGLGTIAVQLAKARGARVTGVDRGDKLDLVRALGADRAVDYTREEPLGGGERYDLVLDVASTLSSRACKRVLTSTGLYVWIGHDHYGAAKGRLLGSVPHALGLLLVARLGRQRHLKAPPGARIPNAGESIATLARLLAAGQLTPPIDTVYPLAEAVAALRHLATGSSRGKILVAP